MPLRVLVVRSVSRRVSSLQAGINEQPIPPVLSVFVVVVLMTHSA
jgi:hypothetical protein